MSDGGRIRKGVSFMKDIKRKFIKMLEIEFEDFKEDIETLIEEDTRKKDEGKISNFVYNSNLSVLHYEISKIRSFIEDIDKLDTSKFNNIEEMLEEIKMIFIKKFQIHSFNQAIINTLTRKIEKIQKYLF